MEERSLAELLLDLMIAVIVFAMYLYIITPLAIWLILDPFGIAIDYMGRVSIGLGLSLLRGSVSFKGKE